MQKVCRYDKLDIISVEFRTKEPSDKGGNTMIVQFTAANFKSVYTAAELSLLEANITEFPETLIRSRLDGVGILPTVLLYGANGSGKSAVLEAIQYLTRLIREPGSTYGKEDEPSGFDLLVRNNEREYEYVLRILQGNVTEETLFARSLTDTTYDVVFDRDRDGVFLGETLEQIDVSPLTDDMPMLAFVMDAAAGAPQIKELRELLETIRFVDCAALDDAPVQTALADETTAKLLKKALSCVKSRITDLSAEEGGILAVRDGMKLPMEKLGKGMAQMIRLYALACTALVRGESLLLDDVNQKLHPKAFRFLVEMFTNPGINATGAQLLGTSYDMPTMANSVLRRDEIWMTDCDENGETKLYPLALFLKENGEKVRKDETYFKQFLEGRYGTDIVPEVMA